MCVCVCVYCRDKKSEEGDMDGRECDKSGSKGAEAPPGAWQIRSMCMIMIGLV